MMTAEHLSKLAFILELKAKSEDTSLDYSKRDYLRNQYYSFKKNAVDAIGQDVYDRTMEGLEALLK